MQVLLSELQINDAINTIARDIAEDYKDKEFIIVTILNGAVRFSNDLSNRLSAYNLKYELDYIKISSYEGTNNSKCKLQLENALNVEDKNILIIEDIVDTGNTIEFLNKYFKANNAKEVKVCSLLSKPSKREIRVNVDYLGYSIEDRFVIGYGLDYNGLYRQLQYIGVYDGTIS